jgi:hypothetical protein
VRQGARLELVTEQDAYQAHRASHTSGGLRAAADRLKLAGKLALCFGRALVGPERVFHYTAKMARVRLGNFIRSRNGYRGGRASVSRCGVMPSRKASASFASIFVAFLSRRR